MKQFVLALTFMLALLAFTNVGYSSNVATTEKTEVQEIDVGFTANVKTIDFIFVNDVPGAHQVKTVNSYVSLDAVKNNDVLFACNMCEKHIDPGLNYIDNYSDYNETIKNQFLVNSTSENLIRYLIC